ncbi:hypothetical protein [Alkaliphilus serpentinus]|uniref:Uncharacterized protein n=1 Tax=Alkaliphilus serpentinus TaxID=1482731 RepID=A0A833MEN8_9FIRM|nr:hypothetical protein [Alkaliphilus serpentinus]KAB3531549.1 hypothetical protein F8153_05075 [Alkaliphilus serpentinus]
MTVSTLGWMIVSLIFLTGLIYPIKQYYSKSKNKKLLAIYKKLRIIHPLLGVTIILLGSIHGYLALGTFRLHTGTIVLAILVIMAIIPISGQKIQKLKRHWRPYHRYLSIILWISIIIHILFRNII